MQAGSDLMSSEEEASDKEVNPKAEEPREGKDQVLITFLEPLNLATPELTLPYDFCHVTL